eukprot:m.1279484 g.1279484  ORF g.1279484 m.1279484 type:complete len:96 (-) comp24768_c1_seq3:2408-2695(-)
MSFTTTTPAPACDTSVTCQNATNAATVTANGMTRAGTSPTARQLHAQYPDSEFTPHQCTRCICDVMKYVYNCQEWRTVAFFKHAESVARTETFSP